jgi:hypothetical protein
MIIPSDMNQPPPLPAYAPVPWGTMGALGGALVIGAAAGSMLFPRERIVEKPVEVTVEKRVEVPVEKIIERQVDRIVEKPVEVVRTVEKRVEVPAKLTKEQEIGANIFRNIVVAEDCEMGLGPKSVFPAKDKKIKIFVVGDETAFRKVSKSEVVSRIESVFRRDGFTLVDVDGEFCETVILVNVDLLASNDGITLAGGLTIDIQHYMMGFAGGLWKRSVLRSGHYSQTISYGSNNFYKIPGILEGLAVSASNDLAKAGPTPERKTSK